MYITASSAEAAHSLLVARTNQSQKSFAPTSLCKNPAPCTDDGWPG